MQQFWLCDTETTGLGPQAEPVELGLVRVDENLVELARYESLIKPSTPINPTASAIHGIYDEDVQRPDCPTIVEFFDEMRVAGETFEDVCFIAYNSRFDYPHYKHHMDIKSEFCALRFARRYVAGRDDRPLENHKLATVAAFLDLPAERAHAALGDVLYTLGMLRAVVPTTGKSFLDLIEEAKKPRILETMPWGKHEGWKMEHVPPRYLKWLQESNPEGLDVDMTLTINTLLGKT
jgi:DNA polymerase-3 subunit epsilon